MAKWIVGKGLDNYIAYLQSINAVTDEMIGEAVYDMAKVVADKVRANIVRDTLYVVTGTWFGDSKTMTDRKGNRIGVPSDCWKVLLRTKKGNSGKRVQECTADELIGIGFWMPNASSTGGTPAQYAVSIAEVEERTGFTFFHNLPEEVATAVKQQNNPSDWNIN